MQTINQGLPVKNQFVIFVKKEIQYSNLSNHLKGHNKDIFVKHKNTEEGFIVNDLIYFKKYSKEYSILGKETKDFYGVINGRTFHIRVLAKLIRKAGFRLK